MEEVLRFLKENPTYFLATSEGGQPRVRPFGTIALFEGKLYFQTGQVKDVYRQLMANPRIEICALAADGSRWLRIAATAVRDDRREARAAVLDEYPSLQKMYSPDDGNCEVFWLKDAVAVFSSFTEEPKTVTF
jgi:uncharacterized pyridoxamine 5'-phosphate oxidase family protein